MFPGKYYNIDGSNESSSQISNNPKRTTPGSIKAGILGGGQLGRMLLQEAANYPVETFVLENDPHCPSAHLCHHFVEGNIQNFEDVYKFGKELDVLTIEIESVNVEALEKLEEKGVKVVPSAAAIKIINNKITQKEFYRDHQIASPEFVIINSLDDLKQHPSFLPAVHKIAMGGYDGRGVQVLRKEQDMQKGFDAPSVLEKMVSIKKEIAMMVAMNDKGETAIYPAVEMVVNEELNLLDYQLSPAELDAIVLEKCKAIALKVVQELKSPGVFAIELFVDTNNEVWVNETAPRVHNSGHHTIEANYSSQFDMLWRVMLGYPLGNTAPLLPSAIVNILGAPDHSGTAVYEGLEEVLSLGNVFVHLYGKLQTKPGRKMGHVTIVSNDREELIHGAGNIKDLLKVVSKEKSDGE
jgi:5-(carboxyamino)imidazole ribonucleotide synthase